METAPKESGETETAPKGSGETEPAPKGSGKTEPTTKGSGKPLFKCGSAAPRKTTRIIVKCRLSWL